MFVQQEKLSTLNIPSSRVSMLYRSGADAQLALPNLPSQMGSAFLVVLRGEGKAQVLVGLYMRKSHCSIFYVSDAGEVATDRLEPELEQGLFFAESMGFLLNDVEIDRMTAEQFECYWKELPICQSSSTHSEIAETTNSTEVLSRQEEISIESTDTRRDSVGLKNIENRDCQIFKEQLGKFLASL